MATLTDFGLLLTHPSVSPVRHTPNVNSLRNGVGALYGVKIAQGSREDTLPPSIKHSSPGPQEASTGLVFQPGQSPSGDCRRTCGHLLDVSCRSQGTRYLGVMAPTVRGAKGTLTEFMPPAPPLPGTVSTTWPEGEAPSSRPGICLENQRPRRGCSGEPALWSGISSTPC